MRSLFRIITLIIFCMSWTSVSYANSYGGGYGKSYANTNYYGATKDQYKAENALQQKACAHAAKSLPLYKRRMEHFCGQDPSSTMCRNYRELHRSWTRIRSGACSGRANSSILMP